MPSYQQFADKKTVNGLYGFIDSLTPQIFPYVGIIQIRLLVEAVSASSQPIAMSSLFQLYRNDNTFRNRLQTDYVPKLQLAKPYKRKSLRQFAFWPSLFVNPVHGIQEQYHADNAYAQRNKAVHGDCRSHEARQ